MFSLRYLTRVSTLRARPQCIKLAKNLHDESTNDPPKPVKDPLRTTPGVASKFNVYRDDRATVILDIEEERQKVSEEIDKNFDLADVYSGLNLESKIKTSILP